MFGRQGRSALPYLLLLLFFIVSFVARPLLPVDETRYLTVAWEMYLKHSYAVPTLNFEPYFQKAPLLFWLIDLSWSIFGVSRAAALLVIFAISASVIHLTRHLANELFASADGMAERMPWLMLGSVPFVVYATLILFDLLVTALVLAAFSALIAFSRHGRWRHAVLAGLALGLGVLTKGPVMLIYLAPAVAFYPLWRDPTTSISTRKFLAGVPVAIGVATGLAFAWLAMAIHETSLAFAYDLVWRQAAGRISGSLESAHARPFYFYLLLLPLVLLPWGLSFDLWRSRPWLGFGRTGTGVEQDRRVLRFLILWFATVFLVFSAISGKQPHYLLPILPALILLFGYFMRNIRITTIHLGAASVLGLFAVGQIIASFTILPRYDLSGLADFVAARKAADWAYVGRYHGQITFLARAEKPFDFVAEGTADEWLRAHPAGYLIELTPDDPVSRQNLAYSQPSGHRYFVVLRGGQAAR